MRLYRTICAIFLLGSPFSSFGAHEPSPDSQSFVFDEAESRRICRAPRDTIEPRDGSLSKFDTLIRNMKHYGGIENFFDHVDCEFGRSLILYGIEGLHEVVMMNSILHYLNGKVSNARLLRTLNQPEKVFSTITYAQETETILDTLLRVKIGFTKNAGADSNSVRRITESIELVKSIGGKTYVELQNSD